MADASAFQTGFFTGPADPGGMFTTANNVVGLANAAQQNKLLKQQYAGAQQGVLTNALAAIAANPNASRADFERLGTLVDQGLIEPSFYASEMANIPAQGDPDQFRGIANRYLARLMSPAELYGVQTGYGPGAGAGLQTYVGPGGETVTNTTGNIAGQFGAGPGAPGMGGGNALTTMTQPGTQPAGGAQNPFMVEKPAEAPMAPLAAPQPLAAGEGVTGPTPSQLKTWEASTEQYATDRATASQWAQRVTPLEKLNDLFESDVLTGKGSDIVSDLSKVAATFGIPIEGAQDQATLVSEIDKYASQLARNSGAAANTDNQLAVSITANPSASMDKIAARDVTKVLLGLERLNQGKILAAQSMGVDPRDYADFAVQWGANVDPRAFAFDLMAPEAKAKLVNGMSDKEFARFQQSLNTATQLGLVNPPGASGGQ